MSKKTADGKNTARYPGRYLKKLPIAASRLAHYNGGASLSFRYLDHNTGETATERLTQRELVARLKQCQRQDYWPFFAIFNVRYWSLMLSAFRHFIITDWRGVFCQHSRFAFFL